MILGEFGRSESVVVFWKFSRGERDFMKDEIFAVI